MKIKTKLGQFPAPVRFIKMKVRNDMGKNKSKNKNFKIEYDSAKDKYYLMERGELIQTFYGQWALEEYLLTERGLEFKQIDALLENSRKTK